MSLLLAAALAVSAPVQPHCSWDRPGANPFMGDVVAAVDRYRDIPDEVRATLKRRVAQRRYDEIATIRRDSVEGAYRYTDLRDMHFGSGTVCRSVSRSQWPEKAVERGLVYCEQGHCLIVPTVCRNVSRITRAQRAEARSGQLYGPDVPTPEVTFLAGGTGNADGELQFEAPSAGATRSFAFGLSEVTPPAGSASGLESGSVAADTWQGASTVGFSALPPPAGPVSAGDSGSFVIAGSFGPTPGDLSGLPGASPVPGVTPIPEPSTVAMLALGLAVVLWVGSRRLRERER
jgi:hypothetical protein